MLYFLFHSLHNLPICYIIQLLHVIDIFYYYFIEKDLQELNIDDLIFEQITDSIRRGLSENRNFFIFRNGIQ